MSRPRSYGEYSELMAFVSRNFDVYSHLTSDLSKDPVTTFLTCEQHGEVHRWGHKASAAGFEVLSAIGAHMDRYRHDGWDTPVAFKAPLEASTSTEEGVHRASEEDEGPSGLLIVLTPEQQEEVQRQFSMKYKEFIEVIPDGLLTVQEAELRKFSIKKEEELVDMSTDSTDYLKDIMQGLDKADKVLMESLSSVEKQEIEARFTYVPPQTGQPEAYEAIRATAKHFALLTAVLCPKSRELSLATTHMEEAVMWANAAIARRS